MIGKKKTCVFFLLLISLSLKAQTPDRKGYIGLSAGPSFLMNYFIDNKVETGLSLNLCDFGYVFKKGFGISASWIGGIHHFNSTIYINLGTMYTSAKYELGLLALMVGPMYSVKLSNKSFIDLKAKGGGFITREKVTSDPPTLLSKSIGPSYGFSFTTAYRKVIASHWCMMISADYLSGINIKTISREQRLRPINLNAGIGLRL